MAPATSMASREPSTPPFATVKFQPIYSPTSTIPTPRAHTWKGLRVLTRLADSQFSDMLSHPLFFETLLASSKTQPINPKARRYISPFIKVQKSILISPFIYSILID
jgi:hypothetical protein